MGVAVSDEDGRRAIVDKLYEIDLGREPSVGDEQFWTDRIADHGLSFVVKAIFDAAEAVAYRKDHGQ